MHLVKYIPLGKIKIEIYSTENYQAVLILGIAPAHKAMKLIPN